MATLSIVSLRNIVIVILLFDIFLYNFVVIRKSIKKNERVKKFFEQH
jgi:hypothetical protein